MSVAQRIWFWLRSTMFVVLGIVVVFALVILADPQELQRLAIKLSRGAGLIAKFVPPPLPTSTDVRQAIWLDQAWSHRDRFWFHHASQGTATLPVPYDWFVELERAEFAPFNTPGRLADSQYLQRFGFIPSPATAKGQAFDGRAPQFGYQGDGPAPTFNAAERDRLIEYPDNRDGLPVGFARLEAGIDPATRVPFPAQVGFTCAACHTGHLEYRNVSIRFDGGPAMLDLGKFEPAIALSLVYTLKVPGRFDRFADRIAKRSAGWPAWQDKKKLKAELEETLNRIVITKVWEDQSSGQPHIEEGFGRLDALNRIGNQVFFEDLLPDDIATMSAATTRVPKHLAVNFASRDAPVSFPPIWDTPSFLWSQYDASIFNELVRNAGEALGVAAKINMGGKDATQHFASTVHIPTLVEMEKMLRGADPLLNTPRSFNGLAAPKWEDAARMFPSDPAWRIDAGKVERGRKLYRSFCFECHRGPVRDAEYDRLWPDESFWSDKNIGRKDADWVQIGGRSYFNVVQKPVAEIGTDAQQSKVLIERRVVIPPELALQPVKELNRKSGCRLPELDALNASFGLALMAVVDRTIDKWFAVNPTADDLVREMRGPRPNCPNPKTFTAMGKTGEQAAAAPVVPQYRARPLDGVWATAPYLHNGSVPTLHAMLAPQKDRPKMFCVGSRQFDPMKVGLDAVEMNCATGLTTLDTAQLANSNRGHSFEGTEANITKLPRGVIGRELAPAERDDLIEYLKTL